MRAFEVGDYARTALLRLVERPTPRPGPGEVLVNIRATGVNARDFAIMRGDQYGRVIPPTRIPLSDNAGDVVEVGEGVTDVKPGDRVTMCHYALWLDGPWQEPMRHTDYGQANDGFLVEQQIMPAASLLVIPDCLTYEEASTLQSAALTSWQAVIAVGNLRSGETMVTTGTGGVSVFAMQWAKMVGARCIVTSSSDEKLARMKQLGADEGVNYAAHPQWYKPVMELTGGRGADMVVNNVGMSEVDNCLEASASNGRIMHVGSNSVQPGRKDPTPEPLKRLGLLIIRDLTLKGITVGSRKMFADLMQAMAQHDIRPIIDRVYDFEQANEALAYVSSGDKIGQFVIRVQ